MTKITYGNAGWQDKDWNDVGADSWNGDILVEWLAVKMEELMSHLEKHEELEVFVQTSLLIIAIILCKDCLQSSSVLNNIRKENHELLKS